MAPHQSSSHLQSIYKSRTTILDLLYTQGFNVDDYTDFSMTEVNTLVQNKQLDMLLENSDTNTKTYVKYHLAKSLRPNVIKEYVDDLFTLENILGANDTLIIVVNDEPNDTLQNAVKTLWQTDKQFVVLYNIAMLQFNILEHEKVPQHIRLTDDEKTNIYKSFNIMDDKQIPEISRFDPVALAISLRPGELCKIIRPSKTSVTSNYYRLCIN